MFINGIEVIDSYSFGLGYIFCMVADVFFALASLLLQKSFEIRERRKLQR